MMIVMYGKIAHVNQKVVPADWRRTEATLDLLYPKFWSGRVRIMTQNILCVCASEAAIENVCNNHFQY